MVLWGGQNKKHRIRGTIEVTELSKKVQAWRSQWYEEEKRTTVHAEGSSDRNEGRGNESEGGGLDEGGWIVLNLKEKELESDAIKQNKGASSETLTWYMNGHCSR